MAKEHYQSAHDDLIDEMMEATGCSWEEAYAATADQALENMREKMAKKVDWLLTMIGRE